jgi:hypothetical protein
VPLSKPALLQVFVEKREDAARCVIGAGLIVAESDDAQQRRCGVWIGERVTGILVDLDVVGDPSVGQTLFQTGTGSRQRGISAAETGHHGTSSVEDFVITVSGKRRVKRRRGVKPVRRHYERKPSAHAKTQYADFAIAPWVGNEPIAARVHVVERAAAQTSEFTDDSGSHIEAATAGIKVRRDH